MKLNSFSYLLKQGLAGIRKNKFMSFASFCIMLVSLLIVGLSTLTAINLNRIISGMESKNEVVVIVADDATDDAVTTLGTQLKGTQNVTEVEFFSKDQALEQMKEKMSSEDQELFIYLDTNPLPDTYRLRISDISKFRETTDTISHYSYVSSVKVPTEFAEILINIRNVTTALSMILLIALVIVCLVIISNSIRTSVFARRKEINIMKYVGATNTFIRIPFFVEGTVIGAVSAGIALLVTKLTYDAFQSALSSNYVLQTLIGTSNIIPFRSIILYVTLSYLGAGILLGAFGTMASTRKYLRV